MNAPLWLGAVVAVGTALRFFRLGSKSFWLDEAASAVLARVDTRVFLAAMIHRQANMALYYLLLRGWTKLGSSEVALRSLSVIAGIAAILAIYLLGTHLFGPRVGRVAALLLSVHTFHIRYSQEARAYSLTVLLAIFSSLFFLKSLEGPSRKSWAIYIAVSTLMVYAQAFGGWVLLAQWCSLLVIRRPVAWKPFLLSAAAISCFISPLAFCLLFISDRSQLAWLTKPSAHDLYKFCLALAGDGGSLLLWAYLALVMGVIVAGVSRLRSGLASADVWKDWFLLVWLILPGAVVFVISLRWPMFEPRFLIFSIPPLLLLAAHALSQIRGKVLFAGALAVLLVLSINGAYLYHRARLNPQYTDDWKDATPYVLASAGPEDAVLFSYSEEKLAFDEYRQLLKSTAFQPHEFPEETDLELLTRRPSRPTPQLLNHLVTGYSRVWVLSAFQPNLASRASDAVLRAHFQRYGVRSFGFVRAEWFADRIECSSDQQKVCPWDETQ